MLDTLNAVRAKLPEVEQAFAEKNPDYFEATARLQLGRETPIPPLAYHHLLLNAPNPEACAYHLAKNPQMLTRMWSLEASGQGIQVMKELNDLSAGLRFVSNTAHTGAPSAAHRERQPNSGPPAPIRPVGGSQMNSNSGGYYEGMPMRDYNAWRDAGGGGGRGRR